MKPNQADENNWNIIQLKPMHVRSSSQFSPTKNFNTDRTNFLMNALTETIHKKEELHRNHGSSNSPQNRRANSHYTLFKLLRDQEVKNEQKVGFLEVKRNQMHSNFSEKCTELFREVFVGNKRNEDYGNYLSQGKNTNSDLSPIYSVRGNISSFENQKIKDNFNHRVKNLKQYFVNSNNRDNSNFYNSTSVGSLSGYDYGSKIAQTSSGFSRDKVFSSNNITLSSNRDSKNSSRLNSFLSINKPPKLKEEVTDHYKTSFKTEMNFTHNFNHTPEPTSHTKKHPKYSMNIENQHLLENNPEKKKLQLDFFKYALADYELEVNSKLNNHQLFNKKEFFNRRFEKFQLVNDKIPLKTDYGSSNTIYTNHNYQTQQSDTYSPRFTTNLPVATLTSMNSLTNSPERKNKIHTRSPVCYKNYFGKTDVFLDKLSNEYNGIRRDFREDLKGAFKTHSNHLISNKSSHIASDKKVMLNNIRVQVNRLFTDSEKIVRRSSTPNANHARFHSNGGNLFNAY